jgi:hypothetical protein
MPALSIAGGGVALLPLPAPLPALEPAAEPTAEPEPFSATADPLPDPWSSAGFEDFDDPHAAANAHSQT